MKLIRLVKTLAKSLAECELFGSYEDYQKLCESMKEEYQMLFEAVEREAKSIVEERMREQVIKYLQ